MMRKPNRARLDVARDAIASLRLLTAGFARRRSSRLDQADDSFRVNAIAVRSRRRTVTGRRVVAKDDAPCLHDRGKHTDEATVSRGLAASVLVAQSDDRCATDVTLRERTSSASGPGGDRAARGHGQTVLGRRLKRPLAGGRRVG